MPASMFSGAGFAESPVCRRSSTTILGRSLIPYRRLARPAETSAARRDRLRAATPPRIPAGSLAGTHLRHRRAALCLQCQANPAFECIAVAVGRDALALAVGVDFEHLIADPRGEKQVAHRIRAILRERSE